MNITINKDANTHVIQVEGRIDTLTSSQLEAECIPLICDESPNLTFDCTKVDYISSTGLRVFIMADKKSQSFNGTVTINGLSEFLKDIFDISGLTDLFVFT